jgi:L-ascorbate metabolism protein UlaG (beta-lactamase superfamily)
MVLEGVFSMSCVQSWTYLGQSGFHVSVDDAKISFLVDPWKDAPPGNSAYPKDYILPPFSSIFVTHGHLDHLGDTLTFEKQMEQGGKIVTSFELMLYLMEKGIAQDRVMAMNIGGTLHFSDYSVTMVPAIHSSGIGVFGAKATQYGGEAAGFVFRFSDGMCAYHAGDTDVFSDMDLIRRRYSPQIAFLPIGGIYTMDPESAAYACTLIRPKYVVPMHYGGTFQLPGTPQQFVREVAKQCGDSVTVVIAEPGKTVQFPM